MAFIEVGTPVKIGKHSDTNYEVSNYYNCKLRVLKIIQVKYKISVADLFDNTPGPAIKYNFEEAAKDYAKKLESVGMSGTGVKCWVNNTTAGSNSVTNNFKDNVIAEKVNNISNTKGGQFLENIRNAVKSSGGSMPNPFPNNAASNKFIEGKHLSLPKIWESTSFDSNINVQVTLITPYGSQKAIKKFIFEPMAALWCLSAGTSYDGITYGNPPYVAAFGTGIGFYQLATLNMNQDINVEFNDITKWKQPMTQQISFTITPAINGYAASVNGDVATVNDAFSPPKLTNSGLAIHTPGMFLNSLRPTDEPCQASKASSFNPFEKSSSNSSGGSGGSGNKSQKSGGKKSENYSTTFENTVQPFVDQFTKDPLSTIVNNLRDDFSTKLDNSLGNL